MMASISKVQRVIPNGDAIKTELDGYLRKHMYNAFSVELNSTAGFIKTWCNPFEAGRKYQVYGNANLSIYSSARCNGNCGFCVEKIRPASNGKSLDDVKKHVDDPIYFPALERSLQVMRGLNPSISITGGEPSLDPRLPRIMALIQANAFRKRTITTNGSGLIPNRLIPKLAESGFKHLNISRAHYDQNANQDVMQLERVFQNAELERVIHIVKTKTNVRPRLSCVLLRDNIACLDDMIEYMEWASRMGVDNVVFRQLMLPDPITACIHDQVIMYSACNRVQLGPILSEIYLNAEQHHARFEFVKQVVGYYYYIEIFKYKSNNGNVIDMVCEIADLAAIRRDRERRGNTPIIHEFVFHPCGRLCASWSPNKHILIPSI